MTDSPLDHAVKLTVKNAREQKAYMAHGSDTDLPITLCAYRGSELIAVVVPRRGNRDELLATAQIIAIGFGPDVLSCVFETFHSSLKKNPVTGKAWKPNEMQQVAEEHDGRAKDWVSDALLVIVCNRAGDLASRTLDYKIIDGKVTWLDETFEPDSITGIIPRALTEAMALPSIDVAMARVGLTGSDFGMDFEEKLAHTDCAVVELLDNCAVVLGAERGSERERIIRSSLSVDVLRP